MPALSLDHAAQRRGIALVAVAALLWGTTGIATKTLYQQSELGPLTVGFFRLAFAFPFVAVLAFSRGALRPSSLRGRDLALMLLAGVTLALYQVCYFSAIARVGVTVATLVTLCTAPVIVALVSAMLLRERLGRRLVLALVCAAAGTAALVGMPGAEVAEGDLVAGIALALGSAAGYATVTLLGRPLGGSDPLAATTVSFGAGALALLPLALATGLGGAHTAVDWGLLLYIGAVPTAFAYALFLFALRFARPTVASIVTLLEPLTAAILAWALFGETLGPLGLAGGGLLIGAILLLYAGERRKPALTMR
jgi:DME family drug/metabolite transporter